jgi:cell division protein YceG involved in septum cleavage
VSEGPAKIPRLTKFLFALFLVVLIGAGVATLIWYDTLTEPGPLIEDTNVVVPKGAGLQQIGDLLEGSGVIRSTCVPANTGSGPASASAMSSAFCARARSSSVR